MVLFINWFFELAGQIWQLICSYWFLAIMVIFALINLVISLVLGAQKQD